MSLLKHLLLSVTLVILVILAGTVWLSVDSARQYLSTELQAQSDSAAAALALTLSQPANQDPIIQELLISALYDTGQFHQIEFVDSAGDSLVLRLKSDQFSGSSSAPPWFSDLLPLLNAAATAQVSDGWKQIGQVTVRADAAYARDILWANFLRMGMWVVAAGIAWACLVALLMSWLRRALRVEVEDRVADMLDQRPVKRLPARARFAELESVSQTIDDIKKRVLATSQEQNARIQSLELELNRDDVTGLANRKYFINELRKALNGDGQESSGIDGHVLLFRQRDLAAVNTVMIRANVDGWLRDVGDQVASTLKSIDGTSTQLARLNGSDFVVLLPGIEGPAVSIWIQQLKQALQRQRIQLPNGQFCRWAMALTDYRHGNELGAVLGRLDQALMRAESAGHTDIEYVSLSEGIQHESLQGAGETQWRQLLQEGLAEDRFELAVQKLPFGGVANEASFEATLTLTQAKTPQDTRSEQEPSTISAFLFMPVAVRLGLSAVCDLRAIELAMEWLRRNQGHLILRVSVPSILQDCFMHEMEGRLMQAGDEIKRLYIELDAYGLVEYTEQVIGFYQKASQLGFKLGLRRLLEQPIALKHLHQLRVSYARMDGNSVEEQLDGEGGQALALAVFNTCQRLGIQLYFDASPSQLPVRVIALLQESTVNPTI